VGMIGTGYTFNLRERELEAALSGELRTAGSRPVHIAD